MHSSSVRKRKVHAGTRDAKGPDVHKVNRGKIHIGSSSIGGFLDRFWGEFWSRANRAAFSLSHKNMKQKQEMSYAEFSKKTGLTASSLFRLEQGQQSITLVRLHEVLKRLKATLGDVFVELR
jgi:DNA-binding Xre family transcriptional regulator